MHSTGLYKSNYMPRMKKKPNMSSNLDAYHVGKSTLVTRKISNRKNQRPSNNILEEVLCKVMGQIEQTMPHLELGIGIHHNICQNINLSMTCKNIRDCK